MIFKNLSNELVNVDLDRNSFGLEMFKEAMIALEIFCNVMISFNL